MTLLHVDGGDHGSKLGYILLTFAVAAIPFVAFRSTRFMTAMLLILTAVLIVVVYR